MKECFISCHVYVVGWQQMSHLCWTMWTIQFVLISPDETSVRSSFVCAFSFSARLQRRLSFKQFKMFWIAIRDNIGYRNSPDYRDLLLNQFSSPRFTASIWIRAANEAFNATNLKTTNWVTLNWDTITCAEADRGFRMWPLVSWQWLKKQTALKQMRS